MLLKDLEVGQRFEFADKGTNLYLYGVEGGWFVATGTFQYRGIANGDCPVLVHDPTRIMLIAVAGTYQRSVLPIT